MHAAPRLGARCVRCCHPSYSLRCRGFVPQSQSPTGSHPEKPKAGLGPPEEPFSPWHDRRVVAVCGSTAALMLGQGVANPILPLFANELGASAAAVGMALSAFGFARFALNVPVGLAADRLQGGLRSLLIGGGLLAAAGTAACGLATDTNELLVARLFAGAGNAAYMGAAQIYLSGELSTPSTRARVLGANYTCMLLGVSIGPVIGGSMADATGSLRAPWLFVAGFSAASAACTALALPRIASVDRRAAPKASVPGAWPWREILSTRFVAAGLAHASTFALRQGGRNLLLAVPSGEIRTFLVRYGMLTTVRTRCSQVTHSKLSQIRHSCQQTPPHLSGPLPCHD